MEETTKESDGTAATAVESNPLVSNSPKVTDQATPSPFSDDIIARLENVTKDYGSFRALDGLSFDILAGQICALLGANGAGKTTLIKCLTGLIPFEGGAIHVNETTKTRRNGRQGPWFSYVPEESGLYERMRVEHAIVYFARLGGLSKREALDRMPTWLERFHLTEKRYERTGSLSKGNQQKVKLTCALINNPPLLILDEPFSGLDGDGSALLRESLASIREQGTTILISSHRLDLMDMLADHVVVIAAGKKILDAPLAEARTLYRQNRLEVTFAAVPTPLDGLPGVIDITWDGHAAEFALGPDAQPSEILRALLDRDVAVEQFARHSPRLDEIFRSVNSSKANGSVAASAST